MGGFVMVSLVCDFWSMELIKAELNDQTIISGVEKTDYFLFAILACEALKLQYIFKTVKDYVKKRVEEKWDGWSQVLGWSENKQLNV